MKRTALTFGDGAVSAPGCLLLALLAGTGCGMTSDGLATEEVAADTVFLDPAITIGVEEGDPNYLFGRISSVAVDDEGRVYVGERFGATVRVYDADGTFVRRLAAEREGPGEISYQPAFMTFDGEGRLYIRDGVGVTVFSPVPAARSRIPWWRRGERSTSEM